MNIQEHLSLLGKRCVDKVTGMRGVVTSVSFDLYGCIQAILHPGIDENGKMGEQVWFDIARLDPLYEIPVMDPPDFDFGLVAEGKRGPAEKPCQNKA